MDRIEDVSQLTLPDQSATTVLCLDTLEHVFEARRAVQELMRVLAPGGVLVISVPFAFRVHNFPDDYWRMTPACLERLLSPLAATVVGSVGVENDPHTVLAVAMKAPVASGMLTGVNHLLDAFHRELQAESASEWRRTWPRRLATRWFRRKGDRRREDEYFASRFSLHFPAATCRGPHLLDEMLGRTGKQAGIDSSRR